MIYAVTKAEVKRFVKEVRKAHDIEIAKIYATKDTVTSAANGLTPKLSNKEKTYLNGKGQWEEVEQLFTLCTPVTAAYVAQANTFIGDVNSEEFRTLFHTLNGRYPKYGDIQRYTNYNGGNDYYIFIQQTDSYDDDWSETGIWVPLDEYWKTINPLLGVKDRDKVRRSISYLGKITNINSKPLSHTYDENNNRMRDYEAGDLYLDNTNVAWLCDGETWVPLSGSNTSSSSFITEEIIVSNNRSSIAENIAINGINSDILETILPQSLLDAATNGSANNGDTVLITNTDPELDIYQGDSLVYVEGEWIYLKSSGLRPKSLSFKGYVSSEAQLNKLATLSNDSLSSSSSQLNKSSIGNIWLMKTTIGALEEGDLILRTGTGATDWKVIHERPVSSGSGGIDFTAGRGLELTSSNILNVNFTDCYGTNAIPASNSVFDITKKTDTWTSSLQIQTFRNRPYIDIVQGHNSDGIRIGGYSIFDYYFEEESGSDDYYYSSGSDDYYYSSGSDDYYYSSGSDDYYY